MKKELNDYVKRIDNIIEEKQVTKTTIEEHLIKINFFQHERLIHLLVTLAFALFSIIFIALSFIDTIFSLVAIITFILLIFYIFHYYFLENKVQYLYKQYDLIKELNQHNNKK